MEAPEELRQQTQSATLEEAFINLLPQAQRQAHQAVVIPPYSTCATRDRHQCVI